MHDTQDWYGPETATFGDRVAAARDMADMTQAQLARRLGVRVSTLRAWENDLSEPRANRLSMMAGLLNVSMMWLINGQGEGLDAPMEEASLPASAHDILNELRDLRTDMIARVEQMGRLEKKLRAALKEDLHERAA
ncbi:MULTISPECIES: helix-turn-helix domain-containing protein [unclassified Roseobacter]|uniref:helix-turn-helix domain-containing protein n=1 Tax=unclassified Roseobacter TaxID=196798 RepID=UPI0018A304C6|nr:MULTISPECIES: helix-turn-helix domain-containing protein [unclassified Roseobacter]MDW3182319.1 helix-turn-helix domain-containing protein [Roseobacter sp.]